MWSRVSTKVSRIGRPCGRLAFRRTIMLNRVSSYSTKNRNVLSLLGLVSVGTGLCLTLAQLPATANCNSNELGPKIKIIKSVSELAREPTWQYVVLGCGTAAWETVKMISKNEPSADILIVSPDQEIPDTSAIELKNKSFHLSYTQWKRHVTASIPTHYGSDISLLTKLVVLTGQPEYHVEPENNEVLFGDGSAIRYRKLCIASTGKTRKFNIRRKRRDELGGEEIETLVNNLTDITDFQVMEEELEKVDPTTNKPLHQSVAIIGGGFLGSEIALEAASPSRKVYQLFPENSVLDRYIPTYLAMHLASMLDAEGVTCMPQTVVKGFALERRRSKDMGKGVRHNRVKVARLNMNHLVANYVIPALTHVSPDVSSARHSSFEIDNGTGGISVNRNLQIMEGIYVAGNSASWYDESLGRRRVDRYDHALKTGELVGYNMSRPLGSKRKSYRYQPGFVSNLNKIGVQVHGIGIIDANYKTVGVWCSNVGEVEEHTSSLKKGIVYYIKEDEVSGDEIVGCLLWNTPAYVEEARTLLSSKEQRAIIGLLGLKNKINIGPADSLNIMIEKKKVMSVAEISEQLNKRHPRKEHSRY